MVDEDKRRVLVAGNKKHVKSGPVFPLGISVDGGFVTIGISTITC